jgi:hypothetical protein
MPGSQTVLGARANCRSYIFGAGKPALGAGLAGFTRFAGLFLGSCLGGCRRSVLSWGAYWRRYRGALLFRLRYQEAGAGAGDAQPEQDAAEQQQAVILLDNAADLFDAGPMVETTLLKRPNGALATTAERHMVAAGADMPVPGKPPQCRDYK